MITRRLRRPTTVTVMLAAALLGTVVFEERVQPASAGGTEVPPGAQVVALWMAPPAEIVAARAGLAQAVREFSGGEPARALPVFTAASNDPLVGSYARLYAARAQLALDRPSETARLTQAILAASPSDSLTETTLGLAIEAAAAVRDSAAVFAAYRTLSSRPNSAPAAALFGLLQAAIAAADRPAAVSAFRTLFFDHAASPEAADAIEEMARIKVPKPLPTREDLGRHLTRAERLYGAAKYTDARAAFVAILPLASGEERQRVELRIAQCDLFLKKHLAAAPVLKAHAAQSSARAAEAEYHHLAAIKGLGRIEAYVALTGQLASRFPDSPWAERALNDLGTHYILADEDERAAEVFAAQYAQFPVGAFADRAAWRAGWWAYKDKRFAETIRIFEAAAVAMRRADYRPAWLYWSARAHQELGHRDEALDGFRKVIADYRNSYYGRAARQEAQRILAAQRPAGAGQVSPAKLTWPVSLSPGPRPANAPLIEHLLAAGMYDEAILELRRLQASGQGSSLVDATVAYALNRQGKLRPAITAMRRAYPQFMAEGGEALPQEILSVIFPIDHWPLLQAHATAKQLDPFLVAALVAQESTFQADVRSVANAWGLMQILPATGKRYAATLGIRPFSAFRLTEPDVNVRIGTTYFAELLKQFGGNVAAALAAYNAGENRVVRWLAERPNLGRDEFIDDIPFPETQNYVKRIIGTAEDYRILYGRAPR
jgi:soluble lytic murein transglycosylase